MASLECSNCRYGIHYHGLPEGIEYIFFKWDDWKKIELKKLKSYEIETENLSGYLYAWKCPSCGTFEFFDEKIHVRVTHVYKPETSEPPELDPEREMEFGVFFDDYLWDEITEARVPMEEILDKYSGYYWIKKDEGAMYMYSDREMKHCVAHYKRIEIAKSRHD